MDIHKDFKKGLKEKDPKIWLILGVVLVMLALLGKLLFIAGLMIIGIVAYQYYLKKERKKKT